MVAPLYPSAVLTGRTTRTAAGTPVLGFIHSPAFADNNSSSYLTRLELTVATAVSPSNNEMWIVPANNFGATGTPSVFGRNSPPFDFPPLAQPEGVPSVGRPVTILDWSVLPTLAAANARLIYNQFIIPGSVGSRIVLDFAGGIPISGSPIAPEQNPLLLWNQGAVACSTFDFTAFFA